jgi:HEAT repeat protein
MARATLSSLLKALRGRDADASERAAAAIDDRARTHPEEFRTSGVISALMAMVNHSDYTRRMTALAALDAACPQEAARRILAGLRHPDGRRRDAAAARLGQVVVNGLENLSAELKRSGSAVLVAAVGDERSLVRGTAVQSIGLLEIREGVPALVAALDRDDDFLQGDALLALGKLGKAAAPALSRMTELLGSGNGAYAAQAIGALGAAGVPAVPELERVRGDARQQGDGELEEACGEALKRLKRAARPGSA